MATIRQLFIISSPTETQILDHVPRSDLEVPPYSLIEIIPNDDGTNIEKIQCAYIFGIEESESVYKSYRDPNIYSMITPGTGHARHLLAKILACIDMESESTVDSQGLVDQFSVGIAITLFTYSMAKYEPCDIGNPYYPIDLMLPDEIKASESEVELLTESMFEHFEQAGKLIISSDILCIGKQWVKEIISFWTNWGHCFEPGCSYESFETMYRATCSYLEYMMQTKQQAISNGHHMAKTIENHASCQISRMCEAKEKFGSSIQTIIETNHSEVRKKFDDALSEIDELRSETFVDVTRQSEAAISALTAIVEKAKKDLDSQEAALKAKLQSCMSMYINELTNRAESQLKEYLKELVNDKLDRYVERAVKNVENPLAAKMVQITDLTKSCKHSADEARKVAAEIKGTTLAKRQASRKPVSSQVENRISRLEARLARLESTRS